MRSAKDILLTAIGWICWIIISAFCLCLLYIALQVTTVCSFHTPTGSMMPTILPDESGLVNKWKMGARLFNIFDALEGKQVEIHRLPGYGSLERGDVIVFNYPYLDSDRKRKKIAMNIAKYYCKRAIAIVGDTLEIKDCFYKVRGCPDTLGVADEQLALRRFIRSFSHDFPDPREWPSWLKCCPRDSVIGWTLQNMGPFVIPGKGTQVNINHRNWLLYAKYIEWETGKNLNWADSVAIMDGIPIKSYIFTENYCFAAGDHASDSHDSRYFGLVPEKFIVGTAGLLWRSRDPKRIFRTLNNHP